MICATRSRATISSSPISRSAICAAAIHSCAPTPSSRRSLDGVYRRGEAYMRWLQRISSVLFGTTVGRFLTRYALLPLLGSFAVVEGLQHMVASVREAAGYEVHISSRTTLLAGAGVLFLLLHVHSPLRAGALVRGVRTWPVAPLLIWDIPRWIGCTRSRVRAMRGSPVVRLARSPCPSRFDRVVLRARPRASGGTWSRRRLRRERRVVRTAPRTARRGDRRRLARALGPPVSARRSPAS